MKAMILGLLAETSIHPGAGQSAGFIDLPVAREAATDYPVIVGSSFKGALLDCARQAGLNEAETTRVFGKQEDAGTLLVSDARLLLLPMRSLNSPYKWVTCPHLLERYARDVERSGGKPSFEVSSSALSRPKYLGENEGDLFLEERQFSPGGALPDGLVDALRPLFYHKTAADRLSRQLVVLDDGDFVWFARYGLCITARNVLDSQKKTSKNLWYEETIPPDSLFYSLLAERRQGALDVVRKLFKNHPYIQAGGNETIGQGWFTVAVNGGGA